MTARSKPVIYTWQEGDTIPRVLKRSALLHKDRVAIRHKKMGIWQEYSWKDFYDNVRHVALGLTKLGLKPGEKLFSLGTAEPRGFWVAYGCVSMGAVLVPTIPMVRREELKYCIQHSDATIAVVEDQEAADKILEIKDECPNIRKIIYWDSTGMWEYDDPILMPFEELEEMGREMDRLHPEMFDDIMEKVSPDDVMTIAYTSGTTGWPKGTQWTHKAELKAVESWMKATPFYESDQAFGLVQPDISIISVPSIIAGVPINLPEDTETTAADMREVGWTVGLIMLIEQTASDMQVRISEATTLKRWTWDLCMPIGLKKADAIARGGDLNFFEKIWYAFAHLVLFRPLRDKHGLLKVRNPFVTFMATSPEVMRMYHGIGVQVRNCYMQNECVPISGTQLGEVDSETVGRPFPDVEVRIAHDGEVLARAPRTIGYYKNPEATAKLIDESGWLHTGDAGVINDDVKLVILDRIAHLMKLRDGTVFSPLWIENKLKFSPYIRLAIITGQDQDFIGAMISLDAPIVAHWAETKLIPYTSYSDLSQKKEVYKLILDDIEKRVNSTLPDKMQIKKFAVMPKEMDIDDAEITRTFKLRRGFVAERYKDFIDAMYTGEQEYTLEVVSTYEDGRTALVRSNVKIIETHQQAVEEIRSKSNAS